MKQHNDIHIVLAQNDIDIIPIKKCTDSHNDIEIVTEIQNDIDVVLYEKYIVL